uniref:Odorant-binding protein 28 n=1 Tax=Encarsia formosa TaxID=32400 RepID=A0A514TU03_ENCFO|nr:odorant-binding protein 28 [Encarsia formosa]
MKFLAIVLAACIIGCCSAEMSEEKKNKMKAIRDVCIAQTEIDAAAVEAFHDKVVGGEPYTRDPKHDCYLFCVFQNIGLQRDCGKIDADRFIERAKKANLNVALVTEEVNKCKDRAGKDGCESAGNVMACFIDNKAPFHEMHA